MDQDRTPENDLPTADHGNTVDGSRPGDGSGPVTTRRDTADGEDGRPAADRHEDERREQKTAYRNPEAKPGHAVGGTEGTTDGR